MDKDMLKDARKKANELKPQFNIGKNGVTATFIETVDKYLAAHHIVKIKSLAAVSKDEVAKLAYEISQETDSEIVQKVGFTFVLFRD